MFATTPMIDVRRPAKQSFCTRRSNEQYVDPDTPAGKSRYGDRATATTAQNVGSGRRIGKVYWDQRWRGQGQSSIQRDYGLRVTGFIECQVAPAGGSLPSSCSVHSRDSARKAFAAKAVAPSGDKRAKIIHQILQGGASAARQQRLASVPTSGPSAFCWNGAAG